MCIKTRNGQNCHGLGFGFIVSCFILVVLSSCVMSAFVFPVLAVLFSSFFDCPCCFLLCLVCSCVCSPCGPLSLCLSFCPFLLLTCVSSVNQLMCILVSVFPSGFVSLSVELPSPVLVFIPLLCHLSCFQFFLPALFFSYCVFWIFGFLYFLAAFIKAHPAFDEIFCLSVLHFGSSFC